MKYSDIFELLYRNDIPLNVTICSDVGIDGEKKKSSLFFIIEKKTDWFFHSIIQMFTEENIGRN